MSAGTTDPSEAVTSAEYIHDGYFVCETDRIDLSDLQLDDNDDWLYVPPQCSAESTVQDLYAWLKTEPELDVRSTKHDNIALQYLLNILSFIYNFIIYILSIVAIKFNIYLDNKKCIDTRTFTRPKKRSARMSFESIFEGLPPALINIQKLQDVDITHMENKKYLSAIIGEKESVPPILKPCIKTTMNIISDENSVTSGQESMEVFLNMSQSKGIDSFINLDEPEFNDLLMNVSQPSVLFKSFVTSSNESMFINNDIAATNKNIAQNNGDVEEESSGSINSINETIVQSIENTITQDKTYCTNALSNTFCKEFVQLDLNETYNTGVPSRTSASRSSLDKGEMATLSSTFITEPNANATFTQSQNEENIGVKLLDTTYLSSAKSAEKPNSPMSIDSDMYKPTMHVNKANLNITCNIPSDETESAILFTRETHEKEDILDMSFKVPTYNQSTPMNPNMTNVASKFAAKHLDQSRPSMYPTLKAATSLRRELLAEIQRSDERKLDATYNHISSNHASLRDTKNIQVVCNENETDVLPKNIYHTYKKTMTINQYTSQNETAMNAQKELPMDQRKFYTFTKKSIERTNNIADENIKTRPNMDSTFCKPLLPRAQQKRNIPRTLSKLPQFLQKSNPNLVSSSLKAAGGAPAGRTSISSIGYIKGSQPNIVQNITEKSQLPSKLHPYGKMKSGSEQRLLEVKINTNSQFPMKGATAGSTESIESTQSIHSAPDLDDRLSTCSDSSSHNSCTRQTMNIEQLHKLVQMQEESLKQDSAPKPNRQILQNTWIDEKADLPSPILKNGVEYSETDRHLNIDLGIKCSSPIIGPTGSSHALNNDGNAESNGAKTNETVVIEKTEDLNQAVPKIENKTRLRQPTNWNTGSKPAAVISGIPRPASRIPALRFVRPNAKITQADLRKGCT